MLKFRRVKRPVRRHRRKNPDVTTMFLIGGGLVGGLLLVRYLMNRGAAASTPLLSSGAPVAPARQVGSRTLAPSRRYEYRTLAGGMRTCWDKQTNSPVQIGLCDVGGKRYETKTLIGGVKGCWDNQAGSFVGSEKCS
jgi:hypothetical protein